MRQSVAHVRSNVRTSECIVAPVAFERANTQLNVREMLIVVRVSEAAERVCLRFKSSVDRSAHDQCALRTRRCHYNRIAGPIFGKPPFIYHFLPTEQCSIVHTLTNTHAGARTHACKSEYHPRNAANRLIHAAFGAKCLRGICANFLPAPPFRKNLFGVFSHLPML